MKGKKRTQKVNTTLIIADEKKLKSAKMTIATITQYMKIIDDQKEAIKETIEDLATSTGIDKKTIRKIAKTMYTHGFEDLQQENGHFSFLYETLVEGRKVEATDPVDEEEEQGAA